jgi:hypothetical protein
MYNFMRAIYQRQVEEDHYTFQGYVFFEKKFLLEPETEDNQKNGFLSNLKCLILDRFKRTYQLVIMPLSYQVSSSTHPRYIKKFLESHIRGLFSEETYEFGVMRVKSTPRVHISHKKIRKKQKLEVRVKQAMDKYRKKGFNIPDKIPAQGYVCERKEKGSICDLLVPPIPSKD